MSRPLNFLHLTTFYPPYSFGGDAMYVYRLCHALGDAGHHIDVVHDIDSYHLLHPAPPPAKFADHPNVQVHGLHNRFGSLSPLLTQQTGRLFLKSRQILELLHSRHYDVIHFHNISLLGPEILELRPPLGRSIKLYTTHEHWLICPMHVLWKFNSRVCEKPECFGCTVRGQRPPQLWRYTQLLENSSREVDRFVSPSRFTALMHKERGFYRPVGHLPYFLERVDQDWQSPAPRPQPKPYFLFVGRLEKLKGLQTLIALWNSGINIDLLIAGSGTFEGELRTLASGNPRIRFLGALPQRELGALYHHAIACILPSLTYETFGMIIIEAFARKTPVIVRNLGALPEVVNESGGGFIYQNDVELRSAIKKLAASPQLRNELGEKGYNAFVRLWSKEAHLQLYFDLLRQVAFEKFGQMPWEDPKEFPANRKSNVPLAAIHE